jgi:hypothetical protein
VSDCGLTSLADGPQNGPHLGLALTS